MPVTRRQKDIQEKEGHASPLRQLPQTTRRTRSVSKEPVRNIQVGHATAAQPKPFQMTNPRSRKGGVTKTVKPPARVTRRGRSKQQAEESTDDEDMMSESVEEPAQDAAEDTAPSSLEDIAEDSEEVQTQGLYSENPQSPSTPAHSPVSRTAQAFAACLARSSPAAIGTAAAQAVEVNPSVNTVSDAPTQASLYDAGVSMYELAAQPTIPSPYRSSLPGLGTFEASPRVDNARSMTAEVPSPIIQVSHLSPAFHDPSVSSTSPVSRVSPRTQHGGLGQASPLHNLKGPQSARQSVSPAPSADYSSATKTEVVAPAFDHALVGEAIDPSLDCVVAPNPDSEPLVRVAVPQSLLHDVIAFIKERSVAQLTCDAATQTSASLSPAPQASLAKRKAETEADISRPSQRPRLDPSPEKTASPPSPTPQRFGYRTRRSKMVYNKDGNRDYEAMIDPTIPILDEDDGSIEWDDPMFREIPSFFRPVTGNKRRAAKAKLQAATTADDKSILAESNTAPEDRSILAETDTAPASPIIALEDTSVQAVNPNVNEPALQVGPPGPSTVQNATMQTTTAQTPRRVWGIGGLARSVSRYIPGFNRVVQATVPQPEQQQVATNFQSSQLATEAPSTHAVVEAPQVAEDQATQHGQEVTPVQDADNQTLPDLTTPHLSQHRYDVQTEPRPMRHAANLLQTSHAPATTRATHKRQRQQGKQSFRSIEEIAREKAARYRQRALEEENRATRASELAKKEESQSNGPRRLGQGLENTQTGRKRKRINIDELDVIPNPPGGYGLNEDYFGQSESDEDEETSTKQATPKTSNVNEGPRRKAPRLDYGDTHVLGDPRRARPYTGVYFPDPRTTFTGGNAFGHQESTSDSAREAAREQAAKTDALAAKIAAAKIEARKLRAKGIWVSVSIEGHVRTNKAGVFDVNRPCCDLSGSESGSEDEEEPEERTPQTNSANPSAGSSNNLPNITASTQSSSTGSNNNLPNITAPTLPNSAGPSSNLPGFTAPTLSQSAGPSNNLPNFNAPTVSHSAAPSNNSPGLTAPTLSQSAGPSNNLPNFNAPTVSHSAGPSNNLPGLTAPTLSHSAGPSQITPRATTLSPSASAGPSNDIPSANNRTKRMTTASKSPRSGIAQYSVTSPNDAPVEEATPKRMTTAKKSPKSPYLPLSSTNAEAEEEDASHNAAKPSASIIDPSVPKDNPGKLPSKVNAPLTPKKNVVAVESPAKPVNASAQPPPTPSPSHAALPNPPATIGKINTYGLKHAPKQPSRLKESIRYSTSTIASDDGDADARLTTSDQAQSYSAAHTNQQDNTPLDRGATMSDIPGDAIEWRSGFLQPAIEMRHNVSEYGYEDEQSADSQSCIIQDDDQLDSDMEEYARTYDNGLEVTAVLQNLPNAQINFREGCEPEALAHLESEEEKLEAIRLVENGVERFVNLKEIRDEEGYDKTIDSEHVNFPPARPNYVEAGIMDREVYAFMQENWTDRDMEAADASFTKGLNHWKRTGELLPDDVPT